LPESAIFATMSKWKSLREKVTNWELWPFKLRYFLISPVWLWYCLRSRSFWFFSASNPTLTFGGFEGEGKREMYDQLPEHMIPRTTYIQPGCVFEEVQDKILERGLTYPFIVKPDVGMKGLLFRKIDSEQELLRYHSKMPFEYIIQDLITYPLEVSVFYYRFPNRKEGVITGLIQKELMVVTGDGKRTLWQLIQEHPKARHRQEEMQIKHEKFLDQVLPEKKRYILTYAANLNRGASFTNLSHLISARLTRFFDELSYPTKFYYGRYDIKCASIDSLQEGKDFVILEFNGSGAEPNHVYNCNYSLFQAYREFLMHWKVLYQISRYNHLNGCPYWSFTRGWKFLRAAKRHLRRLEELDTEILI
jgi:hypothetical protein